MTKKEMFYLMMYSTYFIFGYIALDIIVNDHSDSERGIPVVPLLGLRFQISKRSFMCTIPQTG